MRCRVPLLIALALVPLPVSADLVTIEFEGVITETRDDPGLIPRAGVGDTFSGHYFYDDTDVVARDCRLGGVALTTLPGCSDYSFDASEVAVGLRFTTSGGLGFATASSGIVSIRITDALPAEETPDSYLLLFLGASSLVGDQLDFTYRFEDQVTLLLAESCCSEPGEGLTGTRSLVAPEFSLADRLALFRYVALRETRIRPGGPIERVESESSFTGAVTAFRVVPEPTASALLILLGLLLGIPRHTFASLHPGRGATLLTTCAHLLPEKCTDMPTRSRCRPRPPDGPGPIVRRVRRVGRPRRAEAARGVRW